jgi:hypothetical protein
VSAFEDIHRAETIRYVLGLIRGLHKTHQAQVDIYARQPYAAALELIARDRAHRVGQLVAAIEAGLYDQLDADVATLTIVSTAAEATTSRTEAAIRGDLVAGRIETCTRCDGWDHMANECEDERPPQEYLDAPTEHVDYAEAAAVREIEREMAIEAGDDSEIDHQVALDDARNEHAWAKYTASMTTSFEYEPEGDL